MVRFKNSQTLILFIRITYKCRLANNHDNTTIINKFQTNLSVALNVVSYLLLISYGNRRTGSSRTDYQQYYRTIDNSQLTHARR